MDSLITAAARALAAGDPVGALKRVGLRDDAPALALRGIAMAQLGDFVRARLLVKLAARIVEGARDVEMENLFCSGMTGLKWRLSPAARFERKHQRRW